MSVNPEWLKTRLPEWVPTDADLREVAPRVARGWKMTQRLENQTKFTTWLDQLLPESVSASTYMLSSGTPPRQIKFFNFLPAKYIYPDGKEGRIWFADTVQEWEEENPNSNIPGQPEAIRHRAVFWFEE